jgi:hypothetical protein
LQEGKKKKKDEAEASTPFSPPIAKSAGKKRQTTRSRRSKTNSIVDMTYSSSSAGSTPDRQPKKIQKSSKKNVESKKMEALPLPGNRKVLSKQVYDDSVFNGNEFESPPPVPQPNLTIRRSSMVNNPRQTQCVADVPLNQANDDAVARAFAEGKAQGIKETLELDDDFQQFLDHVTVQQYFASYKKQNEFEKFHDWQQDTVVAKWRRQGFHIDYKRSGGLIISWDELPSQKNESNQNRQQVPQANANNNDYNSTSGPSLHHGNVFHVSGNVELLPPRVQETNAHYGRYFDSDDRSFRSTEYYHEDDRRRSPPRSRQEPLSQSRQYYADDDRRRSPPPSRHHHEDERRRSPPPSRRH